MDARRALLAVWSFRGVGAQALSSLLAARPPETWFDTPLTELAELLGVPDGPRAAIVAEASLEAVAARVEHAVRKSRQRVCFKGDREYPAALAEISDAPPLLFFQGPGAVGSPRGHVAIVGTRHTSNEWLEWTRGLGLDCAAQSLVVVSGAAEGVDTAAHRGALDAGGESWAFVASGLDQLDAAPRQICAALRDAGGTIFSEYPPGARADKGLFVHRNRLIAGSSQATVVVRGEADSGARHTVHAAQEQGRVALAVPGAPGERGAEVCRDALRAGARACFDVSDVLAALSLAPTRVTPAPPRVKGAVSAFAASVYRALPRGVFDLELAQLRLPEATPADLGGALTELEIAGWVVSRTGQRYEKRQ